MRIPRSVAAQRLQTWLLVAALVAIILTALLVIDLARNLRTVVINDSSRALKNAVTELGQASRKWLAGNRQQNFVWDRADQELRAISYELLQSYPDVEGGFLWNTDVIGHSFPTYTEPGSTLRQPPFEHAEVLSALEESLHTGRVATRVEQDHKDLVLVAVLAGPDGRLAGWSLRRIFNFSDQSELTKRFFLVAAMLIALIAIGAVLRLSFSLQHGFAQIQAGLERLRTDLTYRLPGQSHELRSVVEAINTMAEGRQKLEAELRREDRLRVMGRVVAGIAHEIRNPLNSMRLTARVLARRLQAQTDAAESVQLITSEIDRLDALLKSLLAFRAGEPPKIRRQLLAPIVDRSLALVKPHASETGVAFLVDNPPECEATVDADFLQQALINLLLNAIDASGASGTVQMAVHSSNRHCELLVGDSGPGFTLDQQERLFEAFYTTKPAGTGLGLAVTRTLLDKMGASIEGTSTQHGARFRIVLAEERI
jgi:signal transduction histidine kinase